MTNLITNIIGAAVRTMTTREIAELTGKEHRNVLRDARAMLVELHGDGGLLSFEQTYQDPQNGQKYPMLALPKRECLILVSGYSVQMRAKIIDRWQELEVGATPALPRTFSEALRALADKTDEAERQAAALAIAAPKVEFVERFVEAKSSSLGIREVVKLLKTNGHNVNERSFTDWLVESGYMYRKPSSHPEKPGRLTPSAQHEKAGRFETKAGQGANGHAVPVYKFTGKGVSWIVGEWAKHQICEVAA